MGKLAALTSDFPYYKSVYSILITGSSLQSRRYNNLWTRDVQDVIFAILMCGWLGGMGTKDKPAEAGKLLTIEEVGEILTGKPGSRYHKDRAASSSKGCRNIQIWIAGSSAHLAMLNLQHSMLSDR